MASDGQIKIDIEIDGKPVEVAAKSLDKLDDSASNVGKGVKSAESSVDSLADSAADAAKSAKGASDSIDGMGDSANKAKGKTDSLGEGTKKASIGIKDLAVSIGLVAVASAAFDVLKSSMDTAIKRFDTLNSFPKVLEALGVSADDSERAIGRLSDGIDGLPTTLDDIAASAQDMYTSFGDIDVATDTAIALNNALLGSGASAEQAKRGTEQYSKALQVGKMDLTMWTTLTETMGVGLVKVAEEFGFAGKSAKNDLYQALHEGTITLDEFNGKLIEVGTGTGIMAKLAKENSTGIATSFGNLRNSAAKGIADIIKRFDDLAKAVTGKDIAQNIDSLKAVVNSSFKFIGRVIDGTTPIFKAFGKAVEAVLPIVEALTPALVGMGTAYAIHATVNALTTAIKANATIVAIATAAKNAYAIATNRMALALALAAIRTKVVGVAMAAYNAVIALSVAVQAAFTTGMSLSSIAAIGLSGAVTILGAAINIMLGPVGWATLAIGALAGAVIGVIKWINRQSDASKKLQAETEKLGEEVDGVVDGVKSSSQAYKDNVREIESTTKANSELANRIQDLTNKENKSAAEKLLLKDSIEQLNGSVTGLNLSYNEEANALSMSSEELEERLQLMQDIETTAAGQERLLEISKEQNEIDMQLSEINDLREEWAGKLESGAVKSKEAKKGVEELNEKESELQDTLVELSKQYDLTEAQIAEAMEKIATSTESSVSLQLKAFAMLSEGNQKLVEDMMAKWQEYEEAATDMFDTISDKATVTVTEMADNLVENQRVISEWADNIATLAERGVDEGLLETLREAGPESAGHVKEIVNSSDKELERLSAEFAKGGSVATDALNKSLGVQESGIMEAVGELVKGTKTTLKDEINAADFGGVGEDVADGLSDGIKKGTPEVENASKDMAKAAEDAARDESETHSPSRVFERIGVDQADGLTLGINKGTSDAIDAARKLAISTIEQFDGFRDEFLSIGTDAMAGLNAGLNAGSARVMATARSIANQIAVTMKNALDIHSPSRLMERDIGFQLPAGIAVGIDKSAKLAYQAMDRLADGLMISGTPEMALGLGSASFAHAATMPSQSHSVTENKYNTTNMDGLFNGATFTVREEGDIKKIAKELNDYITKKSRGNGVVSL